MNRKQYWECPLCHSNLDFGEKCDCQQKLELERQHNEKLYKQEAGSDQFVFNWPPERLKV